MSPQSRKKNTSRRTLLTTLVLVGAALLAGCDDLDWDLMASLAEDWAASNNVWDGENLNMGNLVRLGVDEQIDEIFNGRPAALDAGSVMDDIRKADDLAREGSTQGGPLGLSNIDKAIEMRPNDWSYWEQKGALLLAAGRQEEAQAAFAQSNALVREHVVNGGGDCKTYARNMLTQREQALMAQINLDYRSGEQPPAGLVDRLDSVRAELGLLDTSAGSCG